MRRFWVAALYIDPKGPYPKLNGGGPIAVEHVRKYGGVLEHPAGSKLWGACAMPPPGLWLNETRSKYADDACEADAYGGYTIEVRQVEWGHVA